MLPSFSPFLLPLFLSKFYSFYNSPGSRKIGLQVTFLTPLKTSKSELKWGRTARNSDVCSKLGVCRLLPRSGLSTARGLDLYRARYNLKSAGFPGWFRGTNCTARGAIVPQIYLGFRVLLRSSSSLLRITSRLLRWLRNWISYSMK